MKTQRSLDTLTLGRAEACAKNFLPSPFSLYRLCFPPFHLLHVEVGCYIWNRGCESSFPDMSTLLEVYKPLPMYSTSSAKSTPYMYGFSITLNSTKSKRSLGLLSSSHYTQVCTVPLSLIHTECNTTHPSIVQMYMFL